jgi:hypothetical protein
MPRLHPIDLPCPCCGRQKITYARQGQHGDVYVCEPATGGCRSVVVHRWPKSRKSCGTQALLRFNRFDVWRPCGPDGKSQDRDPDFPLGETRNPVTKPRSQAGGSFTS